MRAIRKLQKRGWRPSKIGHQFGVTESMVSRICRHKAWRHDMMKEKHIISQPFRNPSEYRCYLDGVKAAAEALGYLVDSAAWGGGIPTDLTLYVLAEKPAPVVTAEIGPEQDNAEADAGTE